uniref:Tetratricopeptide repeat protein n=1 Tax=Peronospora matthiolae TaxID=2874970 RepID=A0AAV1T4D2_9STRA
MQDSKTLAELILHCQELLDEGTTSALYKAADVAQACLDLDKTSLQGFLLLARALSRLGRHKDAVARYKSGLALHPEDEELQTGLKEARVAVLNDLLNQSEEESDGEALVSKEVLGHVEADYGDKSSATESCSAQIRQRAQASRELASSRERAVQGGRETQTTVFLSKMERVLAHLDILKLARLAAVYIFSELLNLRRVAIGLGLFFLALLAQAIVHRQKIMVISMLVICLYRTQLKKRAVQFAYNWVESSTDKLGAFAWAPRFIFVIPVFLKVFGQLKFMLFLQQDMRLAGMVLAVTAGLVTNSLRTGAGQQAKLWGEGRRLKFAAYSLTIVYWVMWRGQWADAMRLLGPAFIDAAGIVLGSVTSSELQEVCRRALNTLFSDIASDIHTDVDLDAWFFLGLGNWIVEYWQQPTDFSLEMLSRMLTDCLDSMEKAAVHVFTPELRRLRNQLRNVEIAGELQLLVAYLKQSLNAVPPPRSFGMAVLFAKRCPSFVVFGLLAVIFGVVSLPLVPFVVSEFQDAKSLYDRYRTGRLQENDGLELMLLDSPLLPVWENVKGCIYCLDGSVTFSKAVETGAHLVSAATRISRMAAFASRVKKGGVFANARDIPDHIANAFLVSKDSSLIIEGVRYIRDSAQLQDVHALIMRWWSAGPGKETRRDVC